MYAKVQKFRVQDSNAYQVSFIWSKYSKNSNIMKVLQFKI